MELVDEFVNFYKIGSGDISWIDFIQYVAKKNKPILIATGASTIDDVQRAVEIVDRKKLVLMQCNTNYTVETDKHKFVNLRVLEQYKKLFPDVVLGLSDHTLGHGSVLGATALGARVFEKHFTDDNNRIGPDHMFALNPINWRQMVDLSNEVFETMGDGVKKIEKNEENAFIVQRRSIVCNKSLKKGTILKKEDLDFLRPCPKDSFHPYEINSLIGKKLSLNKDKNESILKKDIC